MTSIIAKKGLMYDKIKNYLVCHCQEEIEYNNRKKINIAFTICNHVSILTLFIFIFWNSNFKLDIIIAGYSTPLNYSCNRVVFFSKSATADWRVFKLGFLQLILLLYKLLSRVSFNSMPLATFHIEPKR